MIGKRKTLLLLSTAALALTALTIATVVSAQDPADPDSLRIRPRSPALRSANPRTSRARPPRTKSGSSTRKTSC